MKKHLQLLMIFLGILSGFVSHADALEASAPMILSTPGNGTNYHGNRTISNDRIIAESWTPTKPGDYHYIKIGITATGYGEVAFTLNGATKDESIGHWAAEPLRKAVNEPFVYRRKQLNNLYNDAKEGFADEISATTVSVTATGSAQTRSRRITTYSSRQAAINAQASTTAGPSVGFVIGSSTYWKWEAGITRDVTATPYNGSYSVTLNDTIGTTDGRCENHPTMDYCTDNGVCSYNGTSTSAGPCGHRWCLCTTGSGSTNSGSSPTGSSGSDGSSSSSSGSDGTSSAGSGPGCSYDLTYNHCTSVGSCSGQTGVGVPGACGYTYCCCASP